MTSYDIKKGKYSRKHFDNSSTPLHTHIFVGERVTLQGKNIEPKWGIYNGTIGTVHEIVFSEGHNPNEGKLPLYVSVERFSYKPPEGIKPFDASNKKVSFIHEEYFKK